MNTATKPRSLTMLKYQKGHFDFSGLKKYVIAVIVIAAVAAGYGAFWLYDIIKRVA